MMDNNETDVNAFGEVVRISIVSMRAQNEGAEVAVSLLLENGEHRETQKRVIETAQYCALGLCRGSISADLYEQIEAAAQLWEAVKRGEYLLSFGGNTVRTLTQKLVQRGYTRAVASAAAEQLLGMGAIDEARELENEVNKCLRKLWGMGRIKAHLWTKGFCKEAMAQLEDLTVEVDFCENCAILLQKKYREVPAAPDARRRMIAALSRYGYSMSEIKEAMHRSQR